MKPVIIHRSETLLPSHYWADAAPIIRPGCALRPNMPEPTFGDDFWDLRGLVARTNAIDAAATINFTKVADPVLRLTMKELAMQRLNHPVAPLKARARPRPAAVLTVTQMPYGVRRLFQFSEALGRTRLQEVTQDDLNKYLRHLKERDLAPRSIGSLLTVAVWLYEARDLLSYDRISIPPWGSKSLTRVAGAIIPNENLTPRVPEAVMGPLLRWALMYVDRFAPDILEAQREVSESDKEAGTRKRLPAVRPALEEWIATRRRKERGIPRMPPREAVRYGAQRPNLAAIAVKIGVSAGHILRPCMDLINAAVQDLGLEAHDLDVRPRTVGECGVPWRAGFSTLDALAEAKHLITACYVVCAYLSGMRDSEVQAIKRGAYKPSRDPQGEITRHKVESTAYKGEVPEGKVRTWVVIEPVAKALSVLEQLVTIAGGEVGEHLFVHLRSRQSSNPCLKGSINSHIRKFIVHVNQQIVPHLGALGIPLIPLGDEAGLCRISTRMFRRTVAWHIANQPFGVVAGMIQFGHLRETMFEGYAGTSASGFRAEVELEQQTARRADILTMYQDAKAGIRPAGPMAEELTAEFVRIRDTLGDLPGKVVDERRRDKMLDHLRVRLFPGLMADCFFEAKDARCLKHRAEKERVVPIAGVCDPHCHNACWLKKHLPVWEASLADVRKLSKRNRISAIQRDILRTKAGEYEAVIRAIKADSHGG